jgi:hypothetical protein
MSNRKRRILDYDAGLRVEQYLTERTALVDMLYLRIDGHCNAVEVGIEDVRAADSIRIDKERDPDWQEVAFVQAWARNTQR